MWPVPEVLENEPRGQYMFSFRIGYDDRREYDRNDLSDVRDVYLYTAEDGVQSLIYADKWSTENNTYGSQPFKVLLYAVCSSHRIQDDITVYWAMQSLGKFSYRFD